MNKANNSVFDHIPVEDTNQSVEKKIEFYSTIFKNLSYFIFLINTDFRVLYTNYFDLNPGAKPLEPMILGNVLKCHNAIGAGCCGTHELCNSCMVRAAISQSFATGVPISEVEAHLKLCNEERNDIDVDVSVAGKVIKISGKDYMVVCVRDITTFKALQRRFLKNEYRLNLAIRETEVYMNLIRGLTSSLDGKLTAMKTISKQDEEDFSSLELLDKYTNPIVSSLPTVMVFCADEENYKIFNNFLGRSYHLVRSKTINESLMTFLNAQVSAVVITGDISINEANMLSDVVHCSSGTHPVIRLVENNGSAAGGYDAVLKAPFSQKQLADKLSELNV
jgi:hypothetical protein